MITALYTAILGIWLSFLIIRVIKRRVAYRVGIGNGNEHDLEKAVRVHGNFTETVPYILIIMILLEMQNYDPILIHGFGISLVLSRILHWYGLSKTSVRSFGRAVGTAITILLLVIGSVFLLFKLPASIFT